MKDYNWAFETMQMINKLTPDIKDKAANPDWFLLRQRLEQASRIMFSQDVAQLLTNIAQLMDAWKSDPSWTSWDEEQRDHITRLLRDYYAGKQI